MVISGKGRTLKCFLKIYTANVNIQSLHAKYKVACSIYPLYFCEYLNDFLNILNLSHVVHIFFLKIKAISQYFYLKHEGLPF